MVVVVQQRVFEPVRDKHLTALVVELEVYVACLFCLLMCLCVR